MSRIKIVGLTEDMVEECHPSKVILELMEVHKVSKEELVKHLGISENAVQKLLDGEKGITDYLAEKLAEVFPFKEAAWKELQEGYMEMYTELVEGKLKEVSEIPLKDTSLKEFIEANILEIFNHKKERILNRLSISSKKYITTYIDTYNSLVDLYNVFSIDMLVRESKKDSYYKTRLKVNSFLEVLKRSEEIEARVFRELLDKIDTALEDFELDESVDIE